MAPHTRRPGVWTFVIDNYVFLMTGTLLALLWANLAPHSYERVAHAMHFVVNDIGMVFFFALATKEIVEAALPGGPLGSLRVASVPVLAAVGGMAGPAAMYAGLAILAGRPDLLPGWAVPCATDIAFSYMAARFILPANHPGIAFLLLLAVADDALGLMLLAVFYPSGPLSVAWFAALMLLAILAAVWLKRRQVRSFWPYTLAAGGLSWAALFLGGFHPALALVPIMPFLPHGTRDLGVFSKAERELADTMNRFEQWWHLPVQIILFFFGLANAGVALSSVGPGTWFVLSALLVGKPVGIVLAMFLAVRVGLRVPEGLGYIHGTVIGLLAGIGFTVALFFSTAAFPAGDILNQVKMGALLSFSAAPLAFGLARAVGLRSRTAIRRP